VRRQALIDLANGPADWTTLAAVVALMAAALEQPAIAPEVGRLFAALYKDLPRPGAEWYENAILNCHLRLPGLSEAERQAVRAARAEYESRSTKPLTDAEGAAKLFLARPLPKGVEANDYDLARLVIQGFTHPAGRDHHGFAPALQTSLRMTEGALAAGEGELKEYLREQAAVLRLIERETTGSG
jgi:hypothetical protein